MEGYRRYAIYWAPARDGALWAFGSGWLGWDAEQGAVPPAFALDLPLPREEIVARPRRYGFHATLKAPMRLAPGRDAAGLDAAVAGLAAGHRAFGLRLRLADLGPFLALVPEGPSPALDALAADCVRELDGFRAPMAVEERARRAEGLGPREAALLDAWGYPFVLEAFRFHLTLTGPLGDEARDGVAAALAPVLAPILAEDQPFEEVALFGEREDGMFRLLRRHPLGRGA